MLLGILGYAGIIGPTPSQSIFGASWYFDGGENFVHLLLGIVGFICAFILPTILQKYLVYILGAAALFFAIFSGFVSNDFYSLTNLENPADTLLHLIVGLWAFYAAAKTRA